jgi:hypothetical protein
MAKIAFILLCHKDPDAIIRQAQRLTATGDYLAIHFDGNASPQAFAAIKAALGDNPNVAFAARRVKCGWGEWSLVRATLNAVEAAVTAFPRATHFYMLSGDCMPIKSAGYAHAFLDGADVDYIESFDFFTSNWIKTGMKEDRLHYRHYFNERKNKALFYGAMTLQQKLGLKREVPADIEMMIGSQWWCLRRRTVEALLAFVAKRRDVVRFFSTTWIPDETFFQTLVRHLVPRSEIESRTLTFLMFTDYGLPVTFYNDHYDLLLSQDFLFARKISPEADSLLKRLGDVWASTQQDFPVAGGGRRLFQFLTGKGRIGRRFAPRFWEQENSLGRDRELVVIVCKKWHVAKRLANRVAQVTDIPTFHYLFDEDSAGLPDLGGIETTLAKRNRHRRAMMRMLFGYYGSDRLIICLDPASFSVLSDFYADKAMVRTLQLACEYDDDYLRGHAQRTGLVGQQTPEDTMNRILPTLRYDFAYEAEQLREAEFAEVYRIAEHDDMTTRAQVLRAVFSLSAQDADLITDTPHLFAD